MKVKIHYHHTDAGGVVYYANYLKFLEEARAEFLAQKGISIKELILKNTLFAVVRQEIDYKLPAFYADTLTINTRLIKIKGATLEFDYEIKNQDKKVISKAKTILACVNSAFKPIPIPQEIRLRLYRTNPA